MKRPEVLKLGAAASAALACLLAALPASAALQSVSGTPDPALDEVLENGAKESVAYSLAHGFPLWYQDTSGLKLELCNDQRAELTPGVPSTPCLTAEPFPTLPRSFPLNFGSEAFYWTAEAFLPFTSIALVAGVPTVVAGGDMLIVLSLEASFQNLFAFDGEQAVFSRIRIRADLPQGRTYLVTHPFGETSYTTGFASEREINQTQDVGNMPPDVLGAPIPPGGPPPKGDFTLALRNGPEPLAGPFDPAINAGVLSTVATGIGPFLRPAATPGGAPLPPVQATNGARYLSNPGNDIVALTVPVTGSPLGPDRNRFTITLVDPPEGFFLNACPPTEVPGQCGPPSQTIVIDRFQVAGKVFDDGPNEAPVAVPDEVATARGAEVRIDVVANDEDVVDPVTNRHGIDPQAIGLPSNASGDLPGTILLSRTLTTANGGTVRRSTTLTTGQMTFLYTPAPGFGGIDTFEYVVQDTGGRISAPATVTVLVGELVVASAEVRPRTGKWRIRGASSALSSNPVTLFGSPRAVLDGAGVIPPVASGGHGSATFALEPDAIEFRIVVDPLPASPITAVTVHLGLPAEDGSTVFVPFDADVDGPFTGVRVGTLTPARLLFVPAQPNLTFGDVAAAVFAGTAYVVVHTTASPEGELRGQIASPLIGTAPIDPVTGAWSFIGPSRVSPGGGPATVTAVSSEGIHSATARLRIR